MKRERVLLTGASGSMGYEAFLELLRRSDRYETRLLLRGSKQNRRRFSRFEGTSGLEIHWGDLANAEDVRSAVENVDAVLHPAALISPAADRAPEQARRTNVGGMANLIDAIRAQEREIRFVAVGSVAQYGDRLPPHHWIRVGDPLMPSVFDYYALTKCEAERMLVESGLPYWASLRQTYIAIPNPLGLIDPIAFHQPLQQRMELITARDAGYGLVQCLDSPEDFWRRIYNMSGGPDCRVRYLDYLERSMEVYGIRGMRRVLDREWFALRNFHCGYFEDADTLNHYTGHYRDGIDDYYDQMEKSAPAWMKIGARICPKTAIRLYLRSMAETMSWMAKGDQERIEAFFGSREAWEKTGDWNAPGLEVDPTHEKVPSRTPLDLEDVEGYASSRGGRCLSKSSAPPNTLLSWQCAHDHVFQASPALLIGGGYWCPDCAPSFDNPSGWHYARVAQRDPALAAIYQMP